MTATKRISALAVGAVGLSLLVPLLAQGAPSTRVTCRLDPASHVLSVAVTAQAREVVKATIRRNGEQIEVSDPMLKTTASCGETPTVTNTERVEVVTDRGGGYADVELDLEGGALSPGLTSESDGVSEVEVVITGTGGARVSAGSGADHLQFLTVAGVTGLNIDPPPGDSDVDIGIPGGSQNLLPLLASGGPGADTIDVAGTVLDGIAGEGGTGNDSLSARGAAFGILGGEEGRDRLVGTPHLDVLVDGPGADTVSGLAGRDVFATKRDGQRDTIDCGGGADLVAKPDRIDRLRSCERVDGRR